MTHTSTEQPEARRLADALEKEYGSELLDDAANELRTLHALLIELADQLSCSKDYIAELEAEQAQRKPLTADEIKEPKNGDSWRVEWWNESCRMMLPADKALDSFRSYKNGTMQFTLKQRAHGITQEKQG